MNLFNIAYASVWFWFALYEALTPSEMSTVHAFVCVVFGLWKPLEILAVSAGYFVWDIYYCWPRDRMLPHAVLFLCACITGLMAPQASATSVFHMFEVSTLFMNQVGQGTIRYRTYMLVGFYSSFLSIRCVWGIYQFWKLWSHVMWYHQIFMVASSLLNVYWGYRMIKKVL
jgi:hypothetical protein